MHTISSQESGQRPALPPRRPDAFFVALSRAADHSVLWIAASVLLAAGGRRARSGAARGLAAIAVTSAVSNGLLKPLFRRQRPGYPEPLIPRPGSFAFPSGHSASAFAFATAVCWHVPALAPVLGPLAGAVACSRVRTGVHHRADVVAGSAIGAAIGLAVTTARITRRPRRPALFPEAVLVTSPRIPRSRDYAAARRKMRRLDLGRFTPAGHPPRYFAHAATVGLNARFARIATHDGIRDRLGRLTYLLAGAHALRSRRPFTCELRDQGKSERLTLTQLSVINAPGFGGPPRLSVPASDPDDRLLDILTVEDVPPSRMLAAAVPVLLRSSRPVPGITLRHAARLAACAGEPLEVTLDGEIAGTLPGAFEVAGNALRVITPLSFVDKDDDTIAAGRTE